MRRAGLLLAVVVAAGCGAASDDESQPEATPGARTTTKPGARPPAAWVETSRGRVRLAQSSYCWHAEGQAVCADYAGPSCEGPHPSPRVTVKRGERIRFVLGFDPEKEVGLSFFAPTRSDGVDLDVLRTPSWTVDRAGAFAVFARAHEGDSSYSGCLVLG